MRKRYSDEEDPGWCQRRARRGRRLYCIWDKGHDGKHLYRRVGETADTRCTFLKVGGLGGHEVVWRCVKPEGHMPTNAHKFPVLTWDQELLTKERRQ